MSQLNLLEPPAESCCKECGRPLPELSPMTERPASHSEGPATEKIAALRAWPTANSARWKVLDAVIRAGAAGRTFDELRVELDMYSAQKRLHDLKKGGWVRQSGERRETRTGSPADCYVITERARDELERRRIANHYDKSMGT